MNNLKKKSIKGTLSRPRLCVYRSNKHIYTQVIIDSEKFSHTLVACSTVEKDIKILKKNNNCDSAKFIGEILAKRCLDKNIKEIIFDKNSYLYHGRIKALADSARESGLIF